MARPTDRSGALRATLLAFLLALALPASAQSADPTTDPAQAVNQTVDHSKSTLDKALDGIGDAAEGVGHAADETGKGIGHAGSAVGHALAAAVAAVGKAAAAATQALGDLGLASVRLLGGVGLVSSLGLAAALLSAGSASAGALAGLGALAGSATAFAAVAVGSGAAWLGGLAADGVLGYVGFVLGLRPEGMPMAVFGTVAVTGSAASAGIGSWAGWSALKKWGWTGGLGASGLAGFTRIDDSELLEHPLRSQIFHVIQENPGIHASGLARQVGVGWGTITHHLEKLERGHLVAIRKVNNQKCFFENGGKVSRQDMAIAGAVKGDTASDIAQFVTTHPMTSQKQMAESLGLSPALVSFHVKKLVNLGVLDKVRHGKETLLTTSDALRRVLAAESSPAAHAELKDESFQYSS
jgi:DNA-binding transcriptional ArsR family regulator